MKHAKSQEMVDNLKVLDWVSSMGISNAVVLAKGTVVPASEGSYAGALLLTTVPGNSYRPFRVATWYFDDDMFQGVGQWQSGSGTGYVSLTGAVETFNEMTRTFA